VRKRKEGGLAPFLLIISQGRGSVWGSRSKSGSPFHSLRILSKKEGQRGETTVARTQTIYEKGKVVFPRVRPKGAVFYGLTLWRSSTLLNEERGDSRYLLLLQKIDWRELPIDSLFIVADPYIIIKRIKISQETLLGMND
jgi:hypothetical protein